MSEISDNAQREAYDKLAADVQNSRLGGGRIIPKSLQQFMLNRLFEIIGLLAIVGVIFAAVSILSWSPADPSLNHATSDAAQNSLGLTGAYLSDFLIQTFGAAVVFLFIPVVLMGWNLTRHHIVQRPILRVLAWIFAGCFLAGALSALPILGAWPLETGLGGISGDVTISIIADLFGSSIHIASRSAAAILLGILGVGLGLYACGLRFREMLSTLTFINENRIDSGVSMVKSVKHTSSLLGRKSLSLGAYVAGLKAKNKQPFHPDKKPWKSSNHGAPLEYKNLAGQNTTGHNPTSNNVNRPVANKLQTNQQMATNGDEINMKTTPRFLSKAKNGQQNRHALKAKTGQFINKIMAGIGRNPQPNAQHIDPVFNPHAFEPIGADAVHNDISFIPELNQEVKAHYHAQQNKLNQTTAYQVNTAPQMPTNRQSRAGVEVVGSAEMGDFYDGPNSYEDYWHDADAMHNAPQQPLMQQPMQTAPMPHAPMPVFDAPAFEHPVFDPHPVDMQAMAHAPQITPQIAPATTAAPQLAHPAFNASAAEPTPNHYTAAVQPQAVEPQPAEPQHVTTPNVDAGPKSTQPFDLSAPQVDVRKGRVVEQVSATFTQAERVYELPSIDLLAMPLERAQNPSVSEKILAANARILENVLAEFRINGEIMNVRPGPVVTLYELEPAPGVKSARVIGLADDIARSMSAVSARIAVISGRNIIGIELPNDHRDMVFLNEIISADEFKSDKYKLPMALGKSIDGTPVVVDLARMPHLLIAGTTGSGKSVGINSMILSILYKMTPDKCKLIMVDPKMLELSVYDGIPHLLTPVVTDPKKAVVALKWSVREMENRYKKMAKMGVRNIEGYNARIKAAAEKGEPLMRTVQTGFDHETGKPVYEHEALEYEELPFIVIVIDEMADLMMVAGKEIETVIQRLAQMARAAGIHMITATQRPSVDVITGSIKANFPTRISFQVTSKIDSRTILNEMGAEQLLGQGDMLHMAGGGRIKRVHGAFVSDEEVESVVNHLKRQGVPAYIDEITVELDDENEVAAADGGPAPTTDENGNELELYDQAVAIVARDKKASTSYIQRKLSIGYNRAATIIERMEDEGVVGPANHAGKRDILIGDLSDF
ncbi:MAG: DNA translocase FtsK 4TM domain-containing protein [Rhizobiales bacterium]|nr:DNA translocase FtsK 4TM domain-containing protein [Hyphomicrobiales bacterium]NRB14239.1 DNA translocase FtsK 4TM domain-containing protein [Hyphomicrobiales bacterium]